MPEMAVRTMPLMRMCGWMGPLCICHRNPPAVCRQPTDNLWVIPSGSTRDTQGIHGKLQKIYGKSAGNSWWMIARGNTWESYRESTGIPKKPNEKNTGDLEMIHRWFTGNSWNIAKISTGSLQKMGNPQEIHGFPTVSSWGIYRSCMEDWQRICG